MPHAVLGIRHHGPGSARMVRAALESLKPDAVLIEGPPDASDLIALAGDESMKPPVALLVYEPDTPANAAYYPFAEFSPEWQAIRWALANKSEVRFIDLPFAHRHAVPDDGEDEPPPLPEEAAAPAPPAPSSPNLALPTPNSPSPTPNSALGTPNSPPPDPLDQLAHAAGYDDGEVWWGRLIEEQHGDNEPLSVFAAIHDAIAATRPDLTPNSELGTPNSSSSSTPNSELRTRHSDLATRPSDIIREAHMRRSIRAAMKEGFSNIAVVCGAYHAPVLTAEVLKAHPAKADDAALKNLPKRKTAATWIPWTYDRLSMWSGYGAGVQSPGWYEHLWRYPDGRSERWMALVARLLREEDLDASPAHIIEATRLARTLATLRGRSIVGLAELTEATVSVLLSANALPLKVIERKLIVGIRLGEIPDHAPAVPLQRDLAAQQKSLRLKVSADDTLLDLDQRKDIDLARSRLLHRLSILRIDWGELQADSRRTKGTFHEVWKLQWRPELAVRVIDAARFGNTVAEAAANACHTAAAESDHLPHLTELLDHALLADLPGAVSRIIDRIQDVSAVAADLGHLMLALPPLAGVLRYGNVRKADAALVEPVVTGLLARVCAGLAPACASLDDDAAEQMASQIDAVQSALATLDRPDLTDPWRERLRTLGDAQVHGRVAGRCWRILFDARAVEESQTAERLSLALSPGNDPESASAWLEGFASGSGLVLVHDRSLLGIIDGWVSSLPADIFERVCPIVRRTFSTFTKPERRKIGEAIKRSGGPIEAPSAGGAITDDYDPARGELVVPVLQLILGEPA